MNELILLASIGFVVFGLIIAFDAYYAKKVRKFGENYKGVEL